jgi:4'-phosphopantetheinyl transferase
VNWCLVSWIRPGPVPQPYLHVLDDVESSRVWALRRSVDQARSAAAAAMLRQLAGDLLGVPPTGVRIDRTCPDCGRPHGKPTLPGTDLHVSVTHSGERAAAALTREGPVGVDVELVTTQDHAALTDQILGPDERTGDFYTYWTRKESVVKATGDGLRVPLRDVRVSAPDEAPALRGYPGRPDLRAWLRDLAPGQDYRGSVTVLTANELVLVERCWPAATAWITSATSRRRRDPDGNCR